MIVFWVTLLVLHQGYSLVPVMTAQLGAPATVTCALPKKDLTSRKIHWYKQSVGDTLNLILILWDSTVQYGPEFSKSRLEVKNSENFSNLTILRMTREDEGMYHCAVTEWVNPEWSATYLLVKGNTQSNYTVVQTVSDPVRPGDPVTLRCSVLSDSENKTCPGDPSVYWFRAGSEESHPNIIYTDGNDQCEQRSDTVKSCVHHFSKTIISSDAGTYYCAVATCGEILFGNGIKVDTVKTPYPLFTAVVMLAVCLAISVIGNFILICSRRVNEKSKAAVAPQQNSGDQIIQQGDEDMRIYSAVVFFMMKTGSGERANAKAAERQEIDAAVKAFGLN